MLWQCFTENARRIVFYAQEAAKQQGLPKVCTEHFLFGLLHDAQHSGVWPPPPTDRGEAGNAAGFVLREIGTDITALRVEIEKHLQIGTSDTPQDMQLSPQGKKVIELAYDEARHLNHNYIGPEHLLLGLIREEKGIAGRVLSQMGINIAPVRSVVSNLVPGANTQAAVKRTFLQILFGRNAS